MESNITVYKSAMHLANIVESGGTVSINKREKQGSLTTLLAFGSRDARISVAQGITIKQILNHQYRPFVRDFEASKLLSDETLGLIGYKLGASGPIKDEVMGDWASQALHALEVKLARAKTPKRIDDLKGEKLFFAKLLQFIVGGNREDLVIEA